MNKLCECDGKTFWCPIVKNKLITYLSRFFIPTTGFDIHALRNNLAYNLQYFEFQVRILKDLPLHSVIRTQTYKTSVIIGMSIVEAFLYYLVVKEEKYKPREYECDPWLKTQNKINKDGEGYLVKTETYRKLDQTMIPTLSLADLIKIAQKEKLLGQKSSKIYSKLSYLRKLRNRVHLQATDHGSGTDWNSFNKKDMQQMKSILHSFMICSYLDPTSTEREYFEYLVD